MSDSITKYFDDQWNDQEFPIKRINNSLTPLQAIAIINEMLLYIEDNEELQEEAELLKQWIKSK